MLVSTVAGELNALAVEWARLDVERLAAIKRETEARNNSAAIASRQDATARKLLDRVGRNIPLKVFTVRNVNGAPEGVVVVEHDRGVRFVETGSEL